MSFRVERAGGAALAALQAGPATVFAAFERSCYVETPAGIACLGGVLSGMGPLNATVADYRPPALNSEFPVSLESARLWIPPASKSGSGDARMGDVPQLTPPAPIRPQAEMFLRWIAGDGEPDDALIGLGPGLTPAGDDFVGGAMIALRAFGHEDVAARIAAWALPLAEARTSRISRAHLECAARGQGHEALHDWLDGFASADLERLSRIGHSSGLDAASGAANALLSAPPTSRRPR